MWHCFKYAGPTASLTDVQRNDPAHPSPPRIARDWLKKRSLKAASLHSLDEVEVWVRRQIADNDDHLGGEVLSSFDDQARFVRLAAESSCDHTALWSRWVNRGTSYVELAVVGE